MNDITDRAAKYVAPMNPRFEAVVIINGPAAEIARLTAALKESDKKYNKFFNLHHTLAVQEAGIKGILCDALEIDHYQHDLYELSQMVTEKLQTLKEDLEDCQGSNTSGSDDACSFCIAVNKYKRLADAIKK